MRPTGLPLLLSTVVVLALAAPASAEVLDGAAIQAAPQYYLMSLPEGPVGEIADAVLGDALGLPFKIDPDIDATMSFQIDGLYAPTALAREFGYRLWNADIALMEKPSSGLWLIPKAKLATALSEGAVLVAPPVGTAVSRPTPTVTAPRVTSVTRPSSSWSWFAWLAAGWAAGVGTVLGWTRLRRRRLWPTALLSAPEPISLNDDSDDADDLIIPVFPSPQRSS
ncbi:hypothetical protein [Brevundimonas sp. TWP2-3-4b2]|uniref:hypothetical protein n=1 Tax=Brevundimonas sp. TWP2-3-4b2 TaxID=2804595 RepID=UPI003CE7E5C2